MPFYLLVLFYKTEEIRFIILPVCKNFAALSATRLMESLLKFSFISQMLNRVNVHHMEGRLLNDHDNCRNEKE